MKPDVERLRGICLELPGVSERPSHGEPTWFVGGKVFATFADNHHGDGHIAVWVPAPEGMQASLIESSPDVYFRPPYVGHRGWVGIELAHVTDEDLSFHLQVAWELVAPKRLLSQVEKPSR